MVLPTNFVQNHIFSRIFHQFLSEFYLKEQKIFSKFIKKESPPPIPQKSLQIPIKNPLNLPRQNKSSKPTLIELFKQTKTHIYPTQIFCKI